MTTPAAPARRATPAFDATAAWSPLADEAIGAWGCAWEAWAGYLARVAAASTPMDVFEAGVRLSLENVDICSRVAASRLGGLRKPLLCDA